MKNMGGTGVGTGVASFFANELTPVSLRSAWADCLYGAVHGACCGSSIRPVVDDLPACRQQLSSKRGWPPSNTCDNGIRPAVDSGFGGANLVRAARSRGSPVLSGGGIIVNIRTQS